MLSPLAPRQTLPIRCRRNGHSGPVPQPPHLLSRLSTSLPACLPACLLACFPPCMCYHQPVSLCRSALPSVRFVLVSDARVMDRLRFWPFSQRAISLTPIPLTSLQIEDEFVACLGNIWQGRGGGGGNEKRERKM